MKKYIIKSHDRDRFLDVLFKLKGQDFLIDEDVLSLNSFKHKYLDDINLYDIYEAIKDMPLVNFKTLKKDIGFIKEIAQINEEVEAYEVNIDDLDILDELKDILKKLPKYNYQKLYDYIDNNNLDEYRILDSSYSYLDMIIIKRMIKNGAKYLANKNDKHQDMRYEMISERQEIEAAIQYIINKDIDLNDVAFINLSSNEKIIRSLLYRYKMPHHFLHDERINHYGHKLVSLLDFYLKPNLKNYQEVIKENIFTYNNEEIITYLEDHFDENKDIFKDFNSFIDESSYYKNLEAKAQEVHALTYPKLSELLKAESFIEAITIAFSFINDGNDDLLNVKGYLEENSKYLKEDNYFLLREYLLNMHIKDEGDGIIIANLFDGINRPYIFLFDVTQDKYPAFKSLKGLLNERSILKSNYPKLAERYDYHGERLAYLQNTNYTFYGIATSNYQGKANEISADIEDYKKINLPLIEHEYNYSPKHHLPSKLAKEAFFDNDILYSSVSALEKYQACNYAYFLNYVLGLYEPFTYELNAASIGTIIHSLFEKLITIYNKDYSNANLSKIKKILYPFFKRFDLLYPKYHYRHTVVRDRILNSFLLELKFLNKLENASYFNPLAQEYKFDSFILPDKVSLKGSIDRVDSYLTNFRILDYKTSDHSLKKTEISKGLSLQLLTYLIIFEKLNPNFKAIGAYYLNVNHPRFSIDSYSYSLKNGLVLNDIDIPTNFNSRHKLKGMTLEDIEGLDINHEYILSRSKTSISKDYLLEHDEVVKAFEAIYDNIYQNMKDGNIDLKPVQGACTYCSYRRICHYRGGIYYDRDIIYDLTSKKEKQ